MIPVDVREWLESIDDPTLKAIATSTVLGLAEAFEQLDD